MEKKENTSLRTIRDNERREKGVLSIGQAGLTRRKRSGGDRTAHSDELVREKRRRTPLREGERKLSDRMG